MTAGHNGGNRLLGIVERIEELEAEKAEIAAQISDEKKGAKSAGFDVKAINELLRERRMSKAEREERWAILETYRAAVGMLDGTPLSESARRRLSGEEPKPETPDASDTDETPAAPPPPLDLDAAREAGRAAARDGKRILDNPFVAGDPRRAAWDEGWCAYTGSDGMEVPPAWRRKKPGKGDGKGGESGAEAGGEPGQGASGEDEGEPE